jgi:hypothetical protein
VGHGIGEVGLAQSDRDLNDLLVKVTGVSALMF